MIREIAVIYVSWRDAEELRSAVSSLAAARGRVPEGGPKVRLVIVDNGGGLDPAALRGLWPDAAVLANPENRGFGPAANQAARSVSSDVLLFLNPDTRAEAEPFSAIARAFDQNPDAVAVAPRLIEMDGTFPGGGPIILSPPGTEDQTTFQLRRLPTLGSDARELLLVDHIRPNNAGRRASRYADRSRGEAFPVEQAAAAALAVRAETFARIGGFDERFVPAWYEDVDLCERLGRQGKIVYLPGAAFRHRGGESASRLGYDRFLPIFYRNAILYRASRYGPAARLTYRLLLAKGMALRLMILPFRRALPRPRPEAARAYLRVLRLALGFPSASPPPSMP